MHKILVLPQAQKDLDRLQAKSVDRVKDTICSLAQDPHPRGCIKLTTEEGYRARVGTYRILYRVDDNHKKVFIYRIKHRKDAYR